MLPRWSASDFNLARELFLGKGSWAHRRIIFRKFKNYASQGTGPEAFRVPAYDSRQESVWLSNVRVFDTVKGGYFTTGDLDVNSLFQIRGFSPAYTLEDSTPVAEYAGDEVIWNGKVWVVSDQVEPIQFGPTAGVVYWRTVLRAADRSGPGITVGP